LAAWSWLSTSFFGWTIASFLAQAIGAVLAIVSITRRGVDRILGIVTLAVVAVLIFTIDSLFFFILIWPT